MTSHSEHQIQCQLVSWFRREFAPVRIFAIPNGGHRHKVVAAKLKAEGVTSGVPDLYIPDWHLWVEMKTEKGRLSEAQRDWMDYLMRCGDGHIVGYGLEDAKRKIECFCSELKKS